MANYNAIAAVSQAIRKHLEDGRASGPFPSATIQLYQPDNFVDTTRIQGVSIYLFNVTLHETRRNLQARRLPDGTLVRPPLAVDLHYLITPWAGPVDTQLRLLGWVMRALDDLAIIPPSLLNANQRAPVFREDESVELVWMPIPLEQVVHIWEVLHANARTSVCYLARYVTLDSTLPVLPDPPVQTRVARIGDNPQ